MTKIKIKTLKSGGTMCHPTKLHTKRQLYLSGRLSHGLMEEMCQNWNFNLIFRLSHGTMRRSIFFIDSLGLFMKKMFSVLAVLFSLGLAAFPLSAIGETYTLSGQAITTKYSPGSWDGKFAFPNVYCTAFPMPEKAISLRQAFFNNQAIFLVDVLYPDKLVATIAVSTVPANQDADEAIAKILNNERSVEKSMATVGVGYKVSELSTDFGRTVGIATTNPSLGDKNGPFPLSRSFFSSPSLENPVGGISVHRLFVRGHDRFEVAVIQQAPQLSSTSVGAEMTSRLTTIADEIVSSLQKCTDSIPARVTNNMPVASGEWHDLYGRLHPNSASIKGIGPLSTQLFFRKNHEDTLHNWAQIGNAIFIPSETLVKRSEKIFPMVAFNGCTVGTDKKCNLSVKFKVITPAGAVSGETQELELWQREAPNLKYVLLPGVGYLTVGFDSGDPLGHWSVEAIVSDKNSNSSLTLTSSFQVVE
jgi:hypothetical protein